MYVVYHFITDLEIPYVQELIRTTLVTHITELYLDILIIVQLNVLKYTEYSYLRYQTGL